MLPTNAMRVQNNDGVFQNKKRLFSIYRHSNMNIFPEISRRSGTDIADRTSDFKFLYFVLVLNGVFNDSTAITDLEDHSA